MSGQTTPRAETCPSCGRPDVRILTQAKTYAPPAEADMIDPATNRHVSTTRSCECPGCGHRWADTVAVPGVP